MLEELCQGRAGAEVARHLVERVVLVEQGGWRALLLFRRALLLCRQGRGERQPFPIPATPAARPRGVWKKLIKKHPDPDIFLVFRFLYYNL